MQPNPTSINNLSPIRWRVACQKRNGTSYLHFLSLSPNDTGSETMAKLKTEYKRIKAAAPYTWWDKDGMFWTPVVEVAVLSEHSTTHLEAQSGGPRCVIVSGRRLDPELTAAFHNPELLSESGCFVSRNERFAIGSGFLNSREAIFMGQELRWLGICILILGGTVFCVGVGAAVGVWSESFDLGISVMSGLATLLACVEAFAFWVYK